MNSSLLNSGVVILDKPTGITSNRALQIVKKKLFVKKAGHGGTLDPLASGMMLLFLNESTKFSRFFLDADKEYVVEMRLGVKTSSYDADGEVTARQDNFDVSESQILDVLPQFSGLISQVPPMYSALKHKGQPLYKFARKGIDIERKARQVNIYKLELMQMVQDSVILRCACSKGTYIRSLIDSIGETLGCYAHVTNLRRTRVGDIKEEQMVKLDDIEQGLPYEIPSVASLMTTIPAITITSSALFYLKQGQSIPIQSHDMSGFVKIIANQSDFVGIGEVTPDGILLPRRLVNSN